MNPTQLLSVLVGGMVFIKQASAQCDGMGSTWGPGIGPPPAGCGGGGPAMGGGGGGGNTGGGTGGGGGGGGCTADSLPCAASDLGNVGYTTVTGSFVEGGVTTSFAANEDVFGPFEAGFGAQQDRNLQRFGCATPSDGYVAEGLDVAIAAEMVIYQCGLEGISGGLELGMIDQCGGHTREYHFHEGMQCLWEGKAAGGHSIRIAEVDGSPTEQFIYGMYENEATGELPLLDACGGHWGFTPESPDVEVYHYHVQGAAPFTVGCIGPNIDGSLVTVEQCRAADPGCDGDTVEVTTNAGTVDYDYYCSCFDGEGSNVGTVSLPVFLTASPTPAPSTSEPTPAPSPAPTPAPSTSEPTPAPSPSPTPPPSTSAPIPPPSTASPTVAVTPPPTSPTGGRPQRPRAMGGGMGGRPRRFIVRGRVIEHGEDESE